MEYTATKEHLTELEKKYGVTIERERAKKPIPTSCKIYGQPFINKYVSQNIERLQKHGFDWKDEDFDTALAKFPNCKSALRWFYNDYTKDGYTASMFSIGYKKYLREFLIAHPPWFKISGKCCDGAKKDVSKDYVKKNGIDLMILGVRRYENGIRSGAYKNCFSPNKKLKIMTYRPIFWFKNEDKAEYERLFDVKHSRCYTEYGLTRTGCLLCPFGRPQEHEPEICKKFEPKLYKAGSYIFKDSMEYTKQYYEFRAELERRDKENGK